MALPYEPCCSRECFGDNAGTKPKSLHDWHLVVDRRTGAVDNRANSGLFAPEIRLREVETVGSHDAARKPEKRADEADEKSDPWIGAGGVESPSAAGEFLDSCRAYLLLVANRELDPRLRGKIAPSDVVQETFVDAQEKLPGFRGRTKEELQAWLRRILLNNLTDVRRRYLDAGKRSVTREQSIDGDSRLEKPADDVVAEGTSPRASMIGREETAVMQEALIRLSDDHRQVITLRNLEQLSFADVAKQLDRSENATRKLWSRAIVRLQEELSALDGDAAG